jgi:hypothetical protein
MRAIKTLNGETDQYIIGNTDASPMNPTILLSGIIPRKNSIS